MKKLKFILLILVSIFCLNSCFTIATMMGEGLLPYPEPKYLFLENIEDFPQIFLSKKVKVKNQDREPIKKFIFQKALN